MEQFPRWRVDVTVGGDLVKTFYETATTSAAAIAKAKHKMRGAVSSAGPFRFKAEKAEAGGAGRHHATKKSQAAPKSQRAMYDEASRKLAEVHETFLEMLPTMRRRDLERLIEKRPALWGRFASYLTSGHVFVDDPPAKTRHHATKKKSPAQLDREIAEWQAARSGLPKHHQDLLTRRKPGGGLRAGYLTPAGWHGDPMAIEDRKLRLEALREQPAPRFPKESGRRSHATKKPSASEYTKLATATSIPRIEKYINEYAFSTNYRVDPETLQITNPIKAPPENWFVMPYRGGYLFGRKL